jgi:hypothetical protein
MPAQIYALYKKREKKKDWSKLDEKYFHEIGEKYDKLLTVIAQEKKDSFKNLIR